MFPRRRYAADQRNRHARAQLRPLDHDRRQHQPVRAAPACGHRPATDTPGGAVTDGDDQPARCRTKQPVADRAGLAPDLVQQGRAPRPQAWPCEPGVGYAGAPARYYGATASAAAGQLPGRTRLVCRSLTLEEERSNPWHTSTISSMCRLKDWAASSPGWWTTAIRSAAPTRTSRHISPISPPSTCSSSWAGRWASTTITNT